MSKQNNIANKNQKISSKIIKIAILIVIFYVLVAFLANTGILGRKYTSLLVPIGINIIMAVSLNLIVGFLGELTLGHAGFMAVGAYAGAIFSLNANLPPILEIIVAIVLGGLFAALFGFLIGMPVLRLRGDYLAIVTLAFNQIIISVINALKVTNGPKGLSKIPLYTNYKSFTIVFVIVIITILFISNLVKSRHGRAISSIRDNYIAAEAIGIKVSKYKVIAFTISAFFAGVAGVLYSHNVGIIKPTTFDYNTSIEVLVIVVLGGMGSIKGSIIAAIILTVLPEALRGADNFRMLLYAIVLIAMMLINASGMKEKIMASNFVVSTKQWLRGKSIFSVFYKQEQKGE